MDGIGYPGIWVCPLSTEMALVQTNFGKLNISPFPAGFNVVSAEHGVQMTFNNKHGNTEPLVMNSNNPSMLGNHAATIEAFQTTLVKFTGSQPPNNLRLQFIDANMDNWFREGF